VVQVDQEKGQVLRRWLSVDDEVLAAAVLIMMEREVVAIVADFGAGIAVLVAVRKLEVKSSSSSRTCWSATCIHVVEVDE
jgi:predicted transcriptional regulator